MMDLPDNSPQASGVFTEALAELARSVSEDPLEQVFAIVADTIRKTAGYRTVALNIYRPQWDDFEAVHVKGRSEAIEMLIGSTILNENVERILARADRRLQQVYFYRAGPDSVWDELDQDFYTPAMPAPAEPGGWHPDDTLIAMLLDSPGQPLGLVSVDEPLSGLRPSDAELKLLQLICSFAEQALRAARRAQAAELESHLHAQLTALSPAVSACTTLEQLDAVVLEAIVEHFGFLRASIYRRAGNELLLERASGWLHEQAPELLSSWDQIAEVLGDERAGRRLVPAARLFGEIPAATASAYNGRGALGWHDDCLLLPWRDDHPQRLRVVVLQDPVARLRPNQQRQRTTELLIDLAASVSRGIAHRTRLDRLASYDPLTGVRNRRGLEALIEANQDVAVLACDLDHFKQINDTHGHHLGDVVLAEFGALLREFARSQDIAARLGGEEFCMILPGTSWDGARATAERLRTETETRLRNVIPSGVTVSIGVAVGTAGAGSASAGAGSAEELLSAADAALYRAKQAGRNRVMMADSDRRKPERL
jgi:diguanylate cyclase (GGDEF)-like protein